MSLTCLNYLVGLSEGEHSCFDDEAPEGDALNGTSGYFLTDPDYGVNVIDNCETNGWTLLSDCRSKAVQEFKTDLRAMLRQEKDSTITPFSGQIGRRSASSLELPSKTYVGVRIKPAILKGAKMVLSGIYLGLSQSAAFTLNIASNDPDFSTVQKAVNSDAGVFNANAFDSSVSLPFWSENCTDELEYYIYLEIGAARPLNNLFTCCGKAQQWQRYIDAAGFQADTVEYNNLSYFGSAAGFSLDAYFECNELDWICELEELNGYHLLDVIARTIQFRGAAIALGRLLDSHEVNLCTSLNVEEQSEKRAFLNKRYSENIQWIAQNLPEGVTDCFKCKKSNSFVKRSIIV